MGSVHADFSPGFRPRKPYQVWFVQELCSQHSTLIKQLYWYCPHYVANEFEQSVGLSFPHHHCLQHMQRIHQKFACKLCHCYRLPQMREKLTGNSYNDTYCTGELAHQNFFQTEVNTIKYCILTVLPDPNTTI